MKKEIKITKLDNGFLLVVVDQQADSRVPIAKYIANDIIHIAALITDIFSLGAPLK